MSTPKEISTAYLLSHLSEQVTRLSTLPPSTLPEATFTSPLPVAFADFIRSILPGEREQTLTWAQASESLDKAFGQDDTAITCGVLGMDLVIKALQKVETLDRESEQEMLWWIVNLTAMTKKKVDALTRRAARDADAVSPDYGVEETKAHKQQHDDLLPGLDQYVALDEGSRTDSTEPSGFPFSPESMTSQQSRQEKEEEIAEQQAPVASGSGLSREELYGHRHSQDWNFAAANGLSDDSDAFADQSAGVDPSLTFQPVRSFSPTPSAAGSVVRASRPPEPAPAVEQAPASSQRSTESPEVVVIRKSTRPIRPAHMYSPLSQFTTPKKPARVDCSIPKPIATASATTAVTPKKRKQKSDVVRIPSETWFPAITGVLLGPEFLTKGATVEEIVLRLNPPTLRGREDAEKMVLKRLRQNECFEIVSQVVIGKGSQSKTISRWKVKNDWRKNAKEGTSEKGSDRARLWCTCQGPSYEDMLLCCGTCPEEWFHAGCVGNPAAYAQNVDWFCTACLEAGADQPLARKMVCDGDGQVEQGLLRTGKKRKVVEATLHTKALLAHQPHRIIRRAPKPRQPTSPLEELFITFHSTLRRLTRAMPSVAELEAHTASQSSGSAASHVLNGSSTRTTVFSPNLSSTTYKTTAKARNGVHTAACVSFFRSGLLHAQLDAKRTPSPVLNLRIANVDPEAPPFPVGQTTIALLHAAFPFFALGRDAPATLRAELVLPSEVLHHALLNLGATNEQHDGTYTLSRSAIFQLFSIASPAPATPTFPYVPVTTGSVTHPLRPAKPTPGSTVYSRITPHLGPTEHFTLRALSTNDLPTMHEWLNDPRVDEFWKEKGTIEKHEQFVRDKIADHHSLSVVGSFVKTAAGGEVLGEPEKATYAEVYWVKEDVLGGVISSPRDYDRGIHMLVGSSAHRGAHRVRAWLPSLVHYCFLDDPRTERVISEPNSANKKMIEYLESVGFVKDGEVELPGKTAAVMVCDKQRFYELCPF